MIGGKAGGLDPRPLHNRDDDDGSRAARKSRVEYVLTHHSNVDAGLVRQAAPYVTTLRY